MNNKTIIFELNNMQSEYAYCLKIMQDLENKVTNNNNPLLEHTYLFDFKKVNNITIKSIINSFDTPDRSTKQITNFSVDKWRVLNYLFIVNCNEEDDIVNLQYFALIRQLYFKKNLEKIEQVFLYIRDKSKKKKNETYFKASLFLCYEIIEHKDCYYGDFYDNKNNLIPEILSIKQTGIQKKFSPLIELESSNNLGIEYWCQPFQSFLYRCKSLGINIEDIKPTELLNNEIAYLKRLIKTKESETIASNNESKKNKSKKTELDELNNKLQKANEQKSLQYKSAIDKHPYRLLLTCKDYFCSGGIKTVKNRNSFMQCEKFNDIVGNMSLLSFYILCLFEYYNCTQLDYSKSLDKFYDNVIAARDICDGLLQLMDNTIAYSSVNAGYFCFRVHSSEDKPYLLNKYRDYIDRQKGANNSFLEFQIVDYSTCCIPEKFVENIHLRKKEASDDDKAKYEELLSSYSDIAVSTFFYPNEKENTFWDSYYDIGENVIHHYGLQLFDSVISSNDGCFLAVSNPDFQLKDDKKYVYASFNRGSTHDYYIPGTQYSVLVPLKKDVKQENTAVNADINYTNLLYKDYEIITSEVFNDKKALRSSKGYIPQTMKEQQIHELGNKLEEDIDKKWKDLDTKQLKNHCFDASKSPCEISKMKLPKIIFFDVKALSFKDLEYFCKAVITFIFLFKNKYINLAILNCTDLHFIEITRMLAVFYNKQGKNTFMKKVQIYFSGENPSNEFLFAGNNILAVLNRAEKLAFARGIHPDCINILTNMLKKRPCRIDRIEEDTFNIAPFDMVHYQTDRSTLFECVVTNLLETDIQSSKTGCKLCETHVRIGSKIHINNFYEAELLFHNNYFTSRFSYMIIESLNKEYDFCNKNKMVLVGYETYSEMLLYEISNNIRTNYNLDIPYIIYEQRNGECFRNLSGIKCPIDECQFIFIIPINSTLTTHNKLQASLKRIIGCELKILANYAVVLVHDVKTNKESRTNLEKKYWSKFNDKTIESSMVKGPDVRYLIEVTTVWHDPLKCNMCFPRKYIDEEPIIETNKVSIIPMQKIGLIDNSAYYLKKKKQQEELVNLDRVKSLSNHLVYKHVERNGNHFSYYFETENFFDQEKQKIIAWLDDLPISKSNEDRIIFNIIVAPMHFSNSGFVEEVNQHVFKNASLVLHLEIEKEFRDNIKTKYSNLMLLYQNLNSCERKSEIRFHFVDDNIVSGATFTRAQSLIRSIFPDTEAENVSVKVFDSIILLLNRGSEYSKMNYQKNNYFSYVDLYISSMRNHEDACVLCKIVEESNKLETQSATNDMNAYWMRRSDKHSCKSINYLQDYKEKMKPDTERDFRRSYCSHMANMVFNSLGNEKNDSEKLVPIIINKLFLVNVENSQNDSIKLEYIISYIKVLSRPFFNFTKSVRKAIFKIILQIFDYLLGNNDIKKHCKDLIPVLDLIDNIKQKEDFNTLYVMLIILMKRLSSLKSTFIIRKDNIQRIFTFYKSLEGLREDKFEIEYLACIKQLMCLSGDEIKGTWLEYLLVHKKELYPDSIDADPIIDSALADFYNKIYIENTRVIHDGIMDLTKEVKRKVMEFREELVKAKDESTREEILNAIREQLEWNFPTEDELENYYYTNFKSIFLWNFRLEYKKQEIIPNRSLIQNICRLYCYILYGKEINHDITVFYSTLASYLKLSTKSKEVRIVIKSSKDTLYVVGDSSGSHTYLRDEPDRVQVKKEFKDVILNGKAFKLNTYYLDNECLGILKYVNNIDIRGSRNKTNMEDVYFCFEFGEKGDEEERLHFLRNVMIFRQDIINMLEEDFNNNAIQDFLTSEALARALSKSKTLDHGYDKIRQEIVENCLTFNNALAIRGENENLNEESIEEIRLAKQQFGYILTVSANVLISNLFRKAITGLFDGEKDKVKIQLFSLNTTLLMDARLYTINARKTSGDYLMCHVDISQIVDVEGYQVISYGDADCMSYIFILLLINAGLHHSYKPEDDVTIWVSTRSDKLIFSNIWELSTELSPKEYCLDVMRKINSKEFNDGMGITLWTLNKFCKYLTRNISPYVEKELNIYCSSEDGGKIFFNIALPILKGEFE